jgi:ParB-like chromosome segregation protein Spo0J
MDEAALGELAASIRAKGLMQPVLVRPVERGSFELIAGERRWRAAQMAGLTEIPALVREVPDETALAMSLIENIQREDLNPMEEASGVQRLVDEFSMTHDQAAGRDRPLAQRDQQPAAPAQAYETGAADAAAGRTRDGTCARAADARRRAPGRGSESRRGASSFGA